MEEFYYRPVTAYNFLDSCLLICLLKGHITISLLDMAGFDVSEEDRIKLYKIAIAHNDVTEALFTTRLFMKTVKDIRDPNFQPLQDAIVIAYARPFTRNKPYGPLDKKWEVFSDHGRQRLHELIVDTRNTLIAHSDKLYRKVQIVPDGTSSVPGLSTTKGLGITVGTKKIAMDMFPRIEALCLDLGGRLDTEMFDLLDTLYGDKKLPPEPFDLV